MTGTTIPTLEALAERLEGNLTRTKAFLGNEAEVVIDLASAQRDYDAHVSELSAQYQADGLIVGKTVGERAAVKERVIAADPVSRDYQRVIAAAEKRLMLLKADLEALRVARGVCRDLLRIRELYDTAERAAQRWAWQRSPLQRRWAR